jgi:O-antigen ligase
MTNRRIPPQRAELYVAMFLLGGATIALANLPGVISPAFNFLFVMFPVANLAVFTDQNSVTGPLGDLPSRWLGLTGLGSAVSFWLLARYGLRGVLDTTRPWRFILFCAFTIIALFGGFRSTVIVLVMILALLFYLERLHYTRLLLPTVFAVLVGGGLMVLFAARLPFAVQRSLTIVPFIRLDPLARMDAENSSEWRVQMWRELLPQIPQYLIVGRGYSFTAAEKLQARGSTEESKVVGNYHNGPLSVILPFGIFGAIGFLWFTVASLRVLYQNYQFGDPAYHKINTFLFVYFLSKMIYFYAVFGAFHMDLPALLGLLGLSISLNGGVAKPVVAPQPKIVFNRFKLHPGVRRPIGA